MSGGKRSTVGFDHLDGDRREFAPVSDQPDALTRHPYPFFPPSSSLTTSLQLKEIEEVRRKPPQAWSSDLPADREEGKRASSPSPSEGQYPLPYTFLSHA